MFTLHPSTHKLDIRLKPIWVRLMNKPGDFAFGPVTNPFPVFWYMLDGCRTIQIDGTDYEIRQGDLVIFPPGSPYRLYAAHSGQPVRYLSLSCSLHIGPFDFHELYQLPKISSHTDHEAIQLLSECWTELVHLFDQLEQELQHMGIANDLWFLPELSASIPMLRLQGAIYEWFAQLLKLLLPQMPDQLPALDQRIVKACMYIQEHVHEPISLEQLAAHVYLSPSHFSHLFKTALGHPPAQYLRNYRIRLAKDLLIRSSLPVSEISRRVGYEELSEFSRTFKRVAGLSPLAYRLEWRQGSY